jgi:hypothetical protein
MNDKTIILKYIELKEVIEKTVSYAKGRGFPVSIESTNNIKKYYIFNKKPESAAVISSVEMFIGLSIIPERLCLELMFKKIGDSVEVKIGYEILMRQFDIVNTKPKNRDIKRGEVFQDSFLQYITNLENMKKSENTKQF